MARPGHGQSWRSGLDRTADEGSYVVSQLEAEIERLQQELRTLAVTEQHMPAITDAEVPMLDIATPSGDYASASKEMKPEVPRQHPASSSSDGGQPPLTDLVRAIVGQQEALLHLCRNSTGTSILPIHSSGVRNGAGQVLAAHKSRKMDIPGLEDPENLDMVTFSDWKARWNDYVTMTMSL